MESTEGKVDGVMSEEPNTGEVKKTEEIKIEEVEDNAVAVPVEHSRVPPARMGKLEFKDLPLDVKRLILGYITHPSDRKSLCLTNKDLREITTPILYRTVKIFVGGPKDLRLSGSLLNRENPGLKHIRNLFLDLEKVKIQKAQIDDSDDSDDDAEEFEDVAFAARQANFTMRLLLDVMPVDTLECFSWNNYMRISIDNWILLWKKQKRLQEIEVDATDLPLMPIIEKDPDLIKTFKDVPVLSLYPADLDGLRVCQKILQASPGVKEMTLSAGAFKASTDRDPEDLQDSSTRAGLYSRTVFSHLQPFDACSPLILKSLHIEYLSLRYAADTYLRAINFSCLKTLEVFHCVGAENLFSQLSKPNIRPGQLKHLYWTQSSVRESHILEAFEELLETLLGLETLHVEIDYVDNLPKVKAITRHGKTLKYLCINIQAVDSTINYDPVDFTSLCTSCPELEQLSIVFPTTSVDSAEASPDFATFLISIKKLRYLRTLKINPFPTTTQGSIINNRGKIKPRCLELYKYKLQRLLQKIFEICDRHAVEMNWGLGNRSVLSVVAVGANGAVMWDGTHHVKLEPVQYVRGQQIDAFGKRSMMAVKIERHLVRFIEPASDILDLHVCNV